METDNHLRELAEILADVLEDIYNKRMGFGLVVFEFHKVGVGDYVSNAERNDMIKALQELAERLEKNEVIPPAIGEA